jgi:amidase
VKKSRSLRNKVLAVMKRKTFLQSLAAGLAVAQPHQLLAQATASPAPPTPPRSSVSPFELDEITVAQLQARMKSGQDSAVSIVEKYLARIEQLDRRGPSLRAVLEVNPDAPAIARSLDKERQTKGPRGPLHGIPVLIKDNVATHDRLTTTAGSLALQGLIPDQEAFLVKQLREAGAVILGKTNLSEWANFRSSHSSSGWSARGGQTRNPYALDRSPCGSSSGSGVAVAANLAPLAVGTETDGSIVCPSSINGVVGIKPTLGLVSRSGIIPIAHSQDTAGPMARTVTDAALLLGALAGSDPGDPATAGREGKTRLDYAAFLNSGGLRGARLGVARQFFGFHARVDQLMEAALQTLRGQGAVLVDPANVASRGKFGGSEHEVLLYEFKADLNAYLKSLGSKAPVASLADLIEFNRRHADEEMPYFGQETFLRAQEKGPLTDQAYLDALEKNHRLSRREGIDAVMNEHQLDALLAPTTGPSWTIDLVHGDHGSGGCSSLAAVAGYPHITVPAGQVFGLPVGLSFFGRAESEPTLIKLTYAFEQASRHRQAPRFLPEADLTA